MLNYDHLVVGGGITGLSTALSLKEKSPNSRVAVLEKGLLPSGASTRNAGFACFGSASEILSDLENMEKEDVLALIQMRYDGIKRLRERLGDDQIDFEQHGGYEVLPKLSFDVEDKIESLNDLLQPIFRSTLFSGAKRPDQEIWFRSKLYPEYH